ncbi:MAG: glycosyltransferase [Flavobacteriales bacterium]|jgi:glycosyltransferase involved in cell wall biosynthesis
MTYTRKKILVFSDWFLPGFKAGGPIRSLVNLTQTLEHDFFIVTRNTDHDSSQPYPDIETNRWIKQSEHVQVLYLSEHAVDATIIRQLLTEASYDFIYLNSLFSPKFTLMPLRIAARLGLQDRVILAPRGMLKPAALSIKSRKKKIFLFISRLLGWFSGIRWHATNDEEADEIRKHYGRNSIIRVAPNLASVITHDVSPAHKESGTLHLVSIARISPEKGILEALEFLKHAHLEGAIRCAFYGTQQNTEYLQQCQNIAAQIDNATIEFPGEIAPEEIPQAIRDAHFFFLPTRGENFGHAIAEALQFGKPVIISDRTPWRNLTSVGAGWDLPLNAGSFAPILKHCLTMSAEEYSNLSQRASSFGKAHAQDSATVDLNYLLFEK